MFQIAKKKKKNEPIILFSDRCFQYYEVSMFNLWVSISSLTIYFLDFHRRRLRVSQPRQIGNTKAGLSQSFQITKRTP